MVELKADIPAQTGMITVSVCYARPDWQFLRQLQVPAESSLQSALEQSGLLQAVPELQLDQVKVGIFGKLKTLQTPLRSGDRVEVYRPLIADPKDARRRRAQKAAKNN